jgi:hypothetical protein
MRRHVNQTRQTHNKTYQYYGKWPFIRLFGMQEFFSVLFSIGNFYAQRAGFRQFRIALEEIKPKSYPYSQIVYMMYLFNCNGWIWSSLFHARDTMMTERLDYFSAVLLVLFSLYFTIVRTALLSYTSLIVLLSIFAIYYSIHVLYLHFVKFDYSYNMAVTAGSGFIFNLIWIVYGLAHIKKHPYMKKAVVMGVVFILAGTLEIFDFPPMFDLVDAHALWHLATIPITAVWYDFLADDARHFQEVRKEATL